MGTSYVTKDGFGIDCDAMTLRFAALCQGQGVATRAQFITAWGAATPAQQMNFVVKVLFGAMRFPDDGANVVTAKDIAGLTTP